MSIDIQSTLGLWSTLYFHHFDRNSEFDHKEEERVIEETFRGQQFDYNSEFDHIPV